MKNQRTGTIVSWIFDRGYGFIHVPRSNARADRYYLHISRLLGEPFVGGTVTFEVLPVVQGKFPTAVNAKIVDAVSGGAQ